MPANPKEEASADSSRHLTAACSRLKLKQRFHTLPFPSLSGSSPCNHSVCGVSPQRAHTGQHLDTRIAAGFLEVPTCKFQLMFETHFSAAVEDILDRLLDFLPATTCYLPLKTGD